MLDHVFRVRWYQRRFHEALVHQQKDRLLAIWHRRAGKDEIVLNGFRELTYKRPGTYWHCFPEYKQARKAIWNGVNGRTGKRRIDEAFPPQIRKRMVDDDMFIELENGSTWQLLGSDRYNATVGAGPVGVAYSEWALCNPAAWGYHKPMIEETQGVAAFITTPRGDNHVKKMLARALKSDRWFAEVLTADQTGALTPEQLAESLSEYEDLYGKDLGLAMFEQEYLCSFSGATVGSYWGGELSVAERSGRMRVVPIDPAHPVHTAWDLGKNVNNPVWCFQVIPIFTPNEAGHPVYQGSELRIVDFYRPETEDLDEWCDWLNERGYNGFDYVPHDIMHKDWGTSRTRWDRLKAKGRKPKMVGMTSVADGITAGRASIKVAVFHANDDSEDERGERMAVGIEGLKAYRREWDADRKTYHEHAHKDWAEHIGSSWRYLGLAWKEAAPAWTPPPKKTLVYEGRPDGTIIANVSVKEAVEAMVRRKRSGRRR